MSKIFDMHIHAYNTAPEPKKLLEKLGEAGMSGGCIFSNRPLECSKKIGSSFDERLEEVLGWKDDNLYPVLWIHPEEKNILKNIEKAVTKGVSAFKVICTDFYVGDKKSKKMLSKIAETGKPVFFHSGILWDGGISSKYNRPLFWESLIDIKDLRFSMGHCSWPWYDECLALYGKFLNSLDKNGAPEMFFDLTPGTPQIYRKDLLTKLFTIGYDVPDNIMFGTDSSANNYNPEWAKKWLKIDGEIFDSLGVGDEIRNKIYHDNLLRFLGETPKDFTHISPTLDGDDAWNINKGRK